MSSESPRSSDEGHLIDGIHREGKVKYIGLSEVSAKTLRRACKVHHISALQTEISPFEMSITDPQIDILKTSKELGVALVAYSPLGRGFITGQYKSPDDFEDGDFRKFSPRFSAENFPKNLKLVDEFVVLSKKKGCTPGQLALAWLLSVDEIIIPIPGTKKEKYLVENLGALDIKLTKEEKKELDEAVSSAEVHGSRYPEAMTKSLYADTPELK